MGFLRVLCIIFLLPVLGVLGNDAYLYYQEIQKEPEAPFHFSEIGYVWYLYSKDTHDSAVYMAGAETWNDEIKPLLKQPTILFAAAPEAFFLFLYVILRIYQAVPTMFVRKVKADRGFAGATHKGKNISYKRK